MTEIKLRIREGMPGYTLQQDNIRLRKLLEEAVEALENLTKVTAKLNVRIIMGVEINDELKEAVKVAGLVALDLLARAKVTKPPDVL